MDRIKIGKFIVKCRKNSLGEAARRKGCFMNHKRIALWSVALAVTACIAFAVYFLIDPIGGDSDASEDKYYLMIGAEGVHDIEVSTPSSNGGCRNANHSPFKKGEMVWIEQLNGDSDLRGVTITAHDTEGNAVYTFSVPEEATDEEIARLMSEDGWLIAPVPADAQ